MFFSLAGYLKYNDMESYFGIKKLNRMKTTQMIFKACSLFFIGLLLIVTATQAQNETDKKIMDDSKRAKYAFARTDKDIENLFKTSYAYAIFPNVGKGAVGVGGAAGSGTVFEKGKAIGTVRMTQVSVGVQLGGQSYREVIFFENKAALDRFKEDNFELAAQTSAVALKSGVSANAKYREGVLVFTEEKSGLMYEAAIGGQKFNFTAY